MVFNETWGIGVEYVVFFRLWKLNIGLEGDFSAVLLGNTTQVAWVASHNSSKMDNYHLQKHFLTHFRIFRAFSHGSIIMKKYLTVIW